MARVAAVQLGPVVGDLAGNLALLATAVRDAVAGGADVVVLPELATCGYVFSSEQEARRTAIAADGPQLAALAALAGDAVLVLGFAERAPGGAVHNSAAVLDRSGVRAVYRKVHLWDREKLVFAPGGAPPALVDTAHGRIGVMICFDLEFTEWTRIAALQGTDLLAVPANWPVVDTPDGSVAAEVQVVAATARLNGMAVALADRCRTERGVRWTGGTQVTAANGVVLARSGPGEGVAVAEVDLSASRRKRRTPLVDLLGDRRPDLYGRLLEP